MIHHHANVEYIVCSRESQASGYFNHLDFDELADFGLPALHLVTQLNESFFGQQVFGEGEKSVFFLPEVRGKQDPEFLGIKGVGSFHRGLRRVARLRRAEGFLAPSQNGLPPIPHWCGGNVAHFSPACRTPKRADSGAPPIGGRKRTSGRAGVWSARKAPALLEVRPDPLFI